MCWVLREFGAILVQSIFFLVLDWGVLEPARYSKLTICSSQKMPRVSLRIQLLIVVMNTHLHLRMLRGKISRDTIGFLLLRCLFKWCTDFFIFRHWSRSLWGGAMISWMKSRWTRSHFCSWGSLLCYHSLHICSNFKGQFYLSSVPTNNVRAWSDSCSRIRFRISCPSNSCTKTCPWLLKNLWGLSHNLKLRLMNHCEETCFLTAWCRGLFKHQIC